MYIYNEIPEASEVIATTSIILKYHNNVDLQLMESYPISII